MVTGASSGTISGQFLGDAAPLAHEDALGCHQREPGRRGYQKWRRGAQKQTKRAARAAERLVKQGVVETRLSRLEAEMARYAGHSEFVERIFGNVEELTDQFRQFAGMTNSAVKKLSEVVTPMRSDFREMAGWILELKKEIAVERGCYAYARYVLTCHA